MIYSIIIIKKVDSGVNYKIMAHRYLSSNLAFYNYDMRSYLVYVIICYYMIPKRINDVESEQEISIVYLLSVSVLNVCSGWKECTITAALILHYY